MTAGISSPTDDRHRYPRSFLPTAGCGLRVRDDTGQLAEGHPSSLKVEGPGADRPALAGEEVVEQFHVSGRRGEVTWRVVERDEPHYWRIDGVVTGRSNGGTVSYRLTPSSAGGTDFTRAFTFPTPGFLFTVADWLFVRGRVKAESSQALKHLGRLLDQME